MGYLHGGRENLPRRRHGRSTEQRRTRALREDAMAGYRRMDAVPEKERVRVRAVGLRFGVHGNARLLDLRQPEVPGRADDFVQDSENVETRNVRPPEAELQAMQDRLQPVVELGCEESGRALCDRSREANRGRQ